MFLLTPSRTAHGIVQENEERKDDGAGTKRRQPGLETLVCQEKSGSSPGPDRGNRHHCPGAWNYDLNPAEIEEWLEEGLGSMGNSLGSRPKDVAGRYESQLKDPQSKVGKLVLENDVPKSAVSFQPPPQT